MERSQEKELNVIYSWNYIRWGGAQIYLLSIIRNAPANWRFTFVIPRNSKPDLIKFFEPYGVDFDFSDHSLFEDEPISLRDKLMRQWSRIRAELSTYFKLRKYDPRNTVIHVESAPWQSWIFLFLLTTRFNVFVTLHNALTTEVAWWRAELWRTRIKSLMNQRRFHLFAANQDAIDNMKFFLPKWDVERITLTRATINPVEIDEVLAENIDRKDIRKKHGLDPDGFIVFCIGQFIDRKGRWVFLEAAAKLAKTYSDIEFVWVGPERPTEEEKAKISGYGLGDRFKFILSADIGTARQDVLRFFRVADVFALPSLWEGLPISILEAMCIGLPTISTEINAIPEAVIDGETGLLIPGNDPGALSDAILKLKSDRKLRDALSAQGREHILRVFDERAAAKVALDAYERSLTSEG